MDKIEKKIHKHQLINKFIYCYRYVHNIIACFTQNNRQLDSFEEFNKGIKFINNSLNQDGFNE